MQGARAEDVELLDQALSDKQVVIAPVVLTELLSAPGLDPDVDDTLATLSLVEVRDGSWNRAGALRAEVLGKRRKARIADALISQF